MSEASPAVIYVRKSTEEEEGRSLRQQREALEEHAARKGWEVVRTIEEVQSAYAERERPGFRQAMTEAESLGGVLLVWALDRFTRKGAEDVLRLFPRGGQAAPFRLVTLDGIDTAESDMRTIVVLRAEMARDESERLGRRIRRARQDARDAGLWASGNAPYGYVIEGSGDSRRLRRDPDTAVVVERMAAEVLAGGSFRSVARSLNADGIAPPNTNRPKAPKGKVPTWHPTTVRAILSNPATAGYFPRGTRAADSLESRVRAYLKDEAGSPRIAEWEPVLDRETWSQVVARLVADKRASGSAKGRRSDGPQTLLGSFLRCSACGRGMAARRWSKGPNAGRFQYVCNSPDPVPGLRHVSAEGARADDFVTRAVLRRLAFLSSEDPADPVVRSVVAEWARLTGADMKVPERAFVTARVEETRAALDRTARMMAEGLLPEETAAGMLRDYRADLDAAERALAALPSEDPAADFLVWLGDLGQDTEDGDPLGQGSAWHVLDADAQRAVIGAALERIDLGPGKTGGRYTPEEWAARFALTWRA